jgi:serine/threonine-protein kinase
MLLTAERTDLTPGAFVAQQGEIFALFDSTTQDSGNVSYGVRVGGERFFVKTAGSPQDSRAFLSHGDRVGLLRNAIRLGRSVSDATLPALRNVVASAESPMLVYEWVEGELVGTSSVGRSDPTSASARFRELPWSERVAALDAIFRLHLKLAQRGWIACDFYDGCLIYDFAGRQIHVVDLDNYRDAPFMNSMGRMFGSTRFMAPEEHELGARIDERTTVFAMGRALQQFRATTTESVANLASRACASDSRLRFEGMGQFYEAWSTAVALAHSGAGDPG